jgi:site-specific recombinase XerD
MSADSGLGVHLHAFFYDYLMAQRDASRHTVMSYRDALKFFLSFAGGRLGKPVAALGLDDLTAELVLAFLDDLEQKRQNAVSTRNVRLAALHVFFRYVASREPAHLALCQRVIRIPLKHAPRPSVDYLEREEMEALFRAGAHSTPAGRRDHVLLCFAYQTGARVQEIVTLRACDLQLEPPAQVRIWGKGRKERVLPLWTQTAGLLRSLLQERNVDPRSPAGVFVNMRGMPLTRWGVRYILAKRVKAAAAAGSTVGNKRVHPHSVRHTTAVHMLQAGADPNAIRDVLGHSSSATTWRYARINMEMKRKAIESCTPEASRPRSPVPAWRRDDDLLAQLEAIGRRNDYVASNRKGAGNSADPPDNST